MSNNSTEERIRKWTQLLYSLNKEANAAQLATALLGLCANIWLVSCIAWSRTLRCKSFFVMVANLGVANALLNAAYMYVTSLRAVDFALMQVASRTQLECLAEVAPLTLGLDSSVVFTLAVCVDRLLAISFPQRYTQPSALYPWLLVGLLWLYVVCDCVALGLSLDDPNGLLDFCFISDVQGNIYSTWNLASTFALSCMAVFFSAASAVKLVCIIGKNSGVSGRKSEMMDSVMSIVIMAVIVFCAQVASIVSLLVINGMPKSDRAQFSNWARLPQLVSSSSNFWIQLGRSTLFRHELLACFIGRRRLALSSRATAPG